jgi:type VI secretion system secreted protein Hcp
VKFNDILISSYSGGGTAGSDGVPMEQVSFNFAKIEISYTRQNAKGQGETTTAGWDQKQNKPT